MKDILCECGHEAGEHIHQTGCKVYPCGCTVDPYDVFRAHIARQDAVVEAAKIKFLDLIREESVDITTHVGQVALWESLCAALNTE